MIMVPPTQLHLSQTALAFPAGSSVVGLSSQIVTLPRNRQILEGFVSHDIGIFQLSLEPPVTNICQELIGAEDT
jgi:hypothetical protein